MSALFSKLFVTHRRGLRSALAGAVIMSGISGWPLRFLTSDGVLDSTFAATDSSNPPMPDGHSMRGIGDFKVT